MSDVIKLIGIARDVDNYNEKNQIVSAIINMIQGKRRLLTNEIDTIGDFAFSEVRALITALSNAANYREKSDIMAYEDVLLGMIMAAYPTPNDIPQPELIMIKTLVDNVNKESYLQNNIEAFFALERMTEEDAEKLIAEVSSITDEFHRGVFYQGLLNFQKRIDKMTKGAKKVFGDYIASEMNRYYKMEDIDEDISVDIEIACDVCRYFINDALINALYQALKLKRNNINYFAARTLLSFGADVPEETILLLANDLVYADNTYSMLKMLGKESLFPQELANVEYLAKSNMVNWLVYPTELGKAPDEIEYLGKVEVKKEIFHILRFRSDSDNLCEENKNVWLVGWANDEGGTFSNFDLYEKFEKGTVEKTLKNIKKKLL